MKKGKLTGAALFPHPPIAVPAVGGEETKKCAATTSGMEKAAAKLAAGHPDTVVIVSPHGPLFRDGPCFLAGSRLTGNLGDFRAPQVSFDEENDEALLSLMKEELTRIGQPSISFDGALAAKYGRAVTLDHGFMVPYYYIHQAFSPKRVISITYGWQDGADQYAIGCALRRAIEKSGESVAFIASGDMSHKVNGESPYGADPMGPVFDASVKKALEDAAWGRILQMPPEVSEPAAECGLRSLQMLAGVLGGEGTGEIFSYEAPFGIGYLTAYFAPQEMKLEGTSSFDPCCRLAREAVEAAVTGRPAPAAKESIPLLGERRAAFVTLHKFGRLRGCIGTILPVRKNLAEEIIGNGRAAALEDPRFPKVAPDELADLVISVDILSVPEEIKDISSLDPDKYGVIVEAGGRTGVLLPHLDGIESAKHQVAIAKAKGGIAQDEPCRLFRFTSVRHE